MNISYRRGVNLNVSLIIIITILNKIYDEAIIYDGIGRMG